MGLYEQIKEVATVKGYSINRLEKELGFPGSSISKYNKNIPSMEKIQKIADFLHVSIADITGEEKEGGEKYYLNEETAEMAQKLFENKDLRVLFDAAKDAASQHFRIHSEIYLYSSSTSYTISTTGLKAIEIRKK